MGEFGNEALREFINSLNLPSEKLGLLNQDYINNLLAKHINPSCGVRIQVGEGIDKG